MSQKLLDAIKILTAAKVEATETIKEADEHGHLTIIIGTNMERLINQLAFVAGVSIGSTEKVDFPPVTNFMGEEITVPKPIKEEDYSVDEFEVKSFVDKVNRLYNEIESIAPEGVLNSYTIPEDQMVLRGVAKKAGVEGYEDRVINESFINDIVTAKKAKEQDEAKQREIDAQLAAQQSTQQPIPPINDTPADEGDEEEEEEEEEVFDELSHNAINKAAEDDAKEQDEAKQAPAEATATEQTAAKKITTKGGKK